MHCRRLLTTLSLLLLTVGTACAEMNAYLERLSVSAEADPDDFRAQLGSHFGASDIQLDVVFRSVERPADAAVCFWLRQRSRQSIATVLHEYRLRRGKGWVNLAEGLGIQPGSPDFKALQRGELGWMPRPSRGKKK